MPRQNFISKESFVAASEKQAKDSVLSIPVFAPNIKLISENKMIDSLRFSYEEPIKKLEYYIDVTVLPLNDQYTRISLHGTYSTGQAFQNHTDVAIALHDFESAITAAMKGDASLYKPRQPKQSGSRKFIQLAAIITASIGFFFLKKKLS